jgi:hypothetical protein
MDKDNLDMELAKTIPYVGDELTLRALHHGFRAEAGGVVAGGTSAIGAIRNLRRKQQKAAQAAVTPKAVA